MIRARPRTRSRRRLNPTVRWDTFWEHVTFGVLPDGRAAQDIISGALATVTGTPVHTVRDLGECVDMAGAHDYEWSNNAAISPGGSTTPFSVIALARLDATSAAANNRGICGIYGGSNQWIIWTQANNAMNPEFSVRNSADSALNASGSGSALVDGTRMQLLVGTWTPDAIRIWIDGELGAENTAGSFDRNVSGSGALTVGNYSSGAVTPFDGEIGYVLHLNGIEFPEHWIKELARNPYAPWEELARSPYIAAAASGASLGGLVGSNTGLVG